MKRMLSWWQGLLALVAVVAFAVAVVGCNGRGPRATKPVETELPFETIAKGDLVLHQEQGPAFAPSYEDMDLMIAVDPAEAQQIADKLSPKRPGLRFDEIASVDYEEYLVVAAYFGAKPSTGYEITIQEIRQIECDVRVVVSLVKPAVGGAMVTHPIHAVKIKKAALTMMGQLTFVLMEETETLLRREHSVLPLPLPPTLFPPDYTPTGPNGEIPTATPYPGEGRPPSAFVTPTPLPISRTTDLAPQLPDEKKSVYIIGRSDGTYEKFLISVYYAGDVKELLKFGPGDVLLYHYLLKPREVIPIEMTAVPASGAVTETPQSP